MKFLADESIEKPVVDWLRGQDLDVRYITEITPSINDEEVIRFANDEGRILITNDKDFGELVFRQSKIVLGVLLIRAINERASNKIRLVREVLEKARNKLAGYFVVVNEAGIRMKKIPRKPEGD